MNPQKPASLHTLVEALPRVLAATSNPGDNLSAAIRAWDEGQHLLVAAGGRRSRHQSTKLFLVGSTGGEDPTWAQNRGEDL